MQNTSDMENSFATSIIGSAAFGLLLYFVYVRYSWPATRVLWQEPTKETEHSLYAHISRQHQLSAEWWTSEEQLALERNAVFSKASLFKHANVALCLQKPRSGYLQHIRLRSRKQAIMFR